MKEKSPAVQWYPKQYLGDDKVLAMDWDARGMHVWLLNLSWQQDPRGTLPDDDALIRRWLGSPTEEIWRRVKPQIMSAWPIQDGRRVNAGMVTASERQRVFSESRTKSVRSRYEKPTKTQKSEEEVPIIQILDGGVGEEPLIDSDLIVKSIIELHPRSIQNARTEHAVVDALIRETKSLGTEKFAADYLLNRTRIYRECTDRWPPGERKMICSADRWFSESKYLEDEQFWKREHDGKAEQRNSEIENAGAEAARILGIRPGNLQVLPGGTRSDSTVTGRGGVGEVGENHRVIEGSVRSVPVQPEVRLPPEAGKTD